MQPHINIVLNNVILFKCLIIFDSENNVTIMNSPTGIWNISDDDNCKNDMTINHDRSYFDNKTQKEINGKKVKYYNIPTIYLFPTVLNINFDSLNSTTETLT